VAICATRVVGCIEKRVEKEDMEVEAAYGRPRLFAALHIGRKQFCRGFASILTSERVAPLHAAGFSDPGVPQITGGSIRSTISMTPPSPASC
jgi:hypothetical protein